MAKKKDTQRHSMELDLQLGHRNLKPKTKRAIYVRSKLF